MTMGAAAALRGFFGGGRSDAADVVARPRSGAAYMRNEQMPLFFRWHPALRDSADDVKAAWRLATARSIDVIQNNGFLSGAIEQSLGSVVGNGLRVNAKPNATALGWTQVEANAWARHVEMRFSLWSENARSCDAGGRFTFGQILGQAYRHWMATGEVLATLPWFKKPGTQFGTKIRLLPAWRLSNQSELPNLCNGVRLDGVGAPIGYRMKYKTAYGSEEEFELAGYDAFGRPLVVHIFDGEPDQVRGISPFTPVLKVTRQFDQLADATLTTTLIQTIFAAMFKSQAPTEEVLEAMKSSSEQADPGIAGMLSAKADWYKQTDINLGQHGKILHGFPGDELQFFRTEHPNASYEPFAKFLLRECSRAAAMTYEEFTGDYKGATFTSNKMGTTVIWPRVLYRRKHIVAPLAQKAYEAWLEEDIQTGGTPYPGGVAAFLAQREAACQAFWLGPTKPQADDEKTAKAAKLKQEIGLPDAVVFEEYGIDPDDAYEQAKREQDRRDELGLKPRIAAPAAPAGNSGSAGGDDPSDTEDQEQDAQDQETERG